MFKRKKVKNEPSIEEMTKDVEGLLAVDKKKSLKDRVTEFGLKYELSFEKSLISAMAVIRKLATKYALEIDFNKDGTIIIVRLRILSWEAGRAWLKENGWLLHFYDNEYYKGKINFTANKNINGLKVEISTEATSDMGGIKDLVEMAQKYEIKEK